MAPLKHQKTASRAKPVTRAVVPSTKRGRPRLVTTEQVVEAIENSSSLREAADKLGVWHGAITMRKEPEILSARDLLRRRGRVRRKRQP